MTPTILHQFHFGCYIISAMTPVFPNQFHPGCYIPQYRAIPSFRCPLSCFFIFIFIGFAYLDQFVYYTKTIDWKDSLDLF